MFGQPEGGILATQRAWSVADLWLKKRDDYVGGLGGKA